MRGAIVSELKRLLHSRAIVFALILSCVLLALSIKGISGTFMYAPAPDGSVFGFISGNFTADDPALSAMRTALFPTFIWATGQIAVIAMSFSEDERTPARSLSIARGVRAISSSVSYLVTHAGAVVVSYCMVTTISFAISFWRFGGVLSSRALVEFAPFLLMNAGLLVSVGAETLLVSAASRKPLLSVGIMAVALYAGMFLYMQGVIQGWVNPLCYVLSPAPYLMRISALDITAVPIVFALAYVLVTTLISVLGASVPMGKGAIRS